MLSVSPYISVILFTLLASPIIQAQDMHTKLSVITENAHSLQYQSKITGKMQGPAATLVEKVITTAGVDFNTKVLPWARAYKEAEKTANTLIYSMVRTPEREDKFHWLGIISKPQYFLYAFKQSEFTANKDATSFKKYRIGTLLNSASYLTLKAEGFTNLVALNNAKQVFGMLRKNRVDFITANKQTFKKICQSYSSECDQMVAVAPIDMPKNSALYFAMSKDSDPTLVNRLKLTYSQLISTGEISTF